MKTRSVINLNRIHVYLDMDGVLADFDKSAWQLMLQYFPRQDLDYDKWSFGLPTETFIEILSNKPGFFENLDLYPWSKPLFAVCDWAFPTSILSSPADGCDDCCTGKTRWLRKHFPTIIHRRAFHFTTDKYRLARPTALLVDDCPHKCEQFENAGGNAYLFDRKAAHKNYLNVIDEIIVKCNEIQAKSCLEKR